MKGRGGGGNRLMVWCGSNGMVEVEVAMVLVILWREGGGQAEIETAISYKNQCKETPSSKAYQIQTNLDLQCNINNSVFWFW